MTSCSWKEIALFMMGFALLATAQLVLADATSLFFSHFWLDELFTVTIVTDPDLAHGMRALANVVDTHPPDLHLLLRLWTAILGSQDEAAFRSFSLLWIFLALLGIYLVLRDVFPPLPALAGVLAVWCHPLILRHAFEARFYGPWCAAAVWYALILSRALRSREFAVPRKGWLAALAVSSIFLCTIHYFGILTLALVSAAVFVRRPPWSKRYLSCLLAIALGPLALVGCLPFFLGQRAALTVGTWITPPDFAESVVGLSPLLLVFGLYYLRRFLVDNLPAESETSAVIGLVSLALLPAVLTVFSLLVQPATMARYILPALVALAPVTAFVTRLLPRAAQVVVCLFLAGVAIYDMSELAKHYRERDGRTNELIAALRALPADVPVVFEYTNSLYVVARYAPDQRERCFFLDFERQDLDRAGNHRIVTRDVARQVRAFGGPTGLMNWKEFRDLPTRLVVPGENLLEPIHHVQDRFPGFTLKPREAGIYELLSLSR